MQTFLTRIPVLFFLCVYHKRNPPASSPNIGSQALPAALICNNGFYDCILSKILSLVIPRASKLFPITFYIFVLSTLNVYTDNLTLLPAFTALIAAADNAINVLASIWTGWSWFVGRPSKKLLCRLLRLFSHTAERFRFEMAISERACVQVAQEMRATSTVPPRVRWDARAVVSNAGQLTDDGRHCAVKEDWRGCAGSQRSFSPSAPSFEKPRSEAVSVASHLCCVSVNVQKWWLPPSAVATASVFKLVFYSSVCVFVNSRMKNKINGTSKGSWEIFHNVHWMGLDRAASHAALQCCKICRQSDVFLFPIIHHL